jgi:hypothetical protein
MKRIKNKHYKFENGFEVYKDERIEGQNKWIVHHPDEEVFEQYIVLYDQLWNTLKEARDFVEDFRVD